MKRLFKVKDYWDKVKTSTYTNFQNAINAMREKQSGSMLRLYHPDKKGYCFLTLNGKISAISEDWNDLIRDAK